MAVRGYGEADGLELLVDAWQALIELTGAELVVGDHAPTLALAAYGVVPMVLVGTGFAIPPTGGRDFPTLDPAARPTASADRVLEVVREVQRRRGRPAPEALPGLLAGAARFVHTFPELDPYRAIRAEAIAEPFRRHSSPVPPPSSRSIFAYVGPEYPGVERLLPYLAGADFRCAAYIRGSPAGLVEAARRAGVEVFDDPPPLDEVLAGVDAVVHHGSLSTAEAALAAGRPSVSLPEHMEQELTARALDELGVGRSLTGRFPVEAVGDALRAVLAPGGSPPRAMELARELEERPGQGCLTRIVDRCLEWLSPSESNGSPSRERNRPCPAPDPDANEPVTSSDPAH
jgi:hypothetical protein